jgi:hypothetical protein
VIADTTTDGSSTPEKNALWKFYWDCGRQGSLSGVFVATKAEVETSIGRSVYFDEVLGKHSEVQGKLDAKDVTLLTDDEAFTAKALEYKIVPTGWNPLEYMPCSECGQLWGDHEPDCSALEPK